MIIFLAQITVISLICMSILYVFSDKLSANNSKRIVAIALLFCLMSLMLKVTPVFIEKSQPNQGVLLQEQLLQTLEDKSGLQSIIQSQKVFKHEQKVEKFGIHISATFIFVAVWFAGIIVSLIQLLRPLIVIRNEKFELKHLKTYKGIQVLYGQKIDYPMLFSFGNTVILLPKQMKSWLDNQLNHVLEHEYCHYLRKDHWHLWFASIVRSVYWFHPLINFLVKKHKQYIELACDNDLILNGTDRLEYAKTLYACVTQNQNYAMASIATHPKFIELRFNELISDKKQRVSKSNITIILVLISTMIISSISWRVEHWVNAEEMIDEMQVDLPSLRARNPIPGEVFLSVFYDGINNQNTFVKLKLKKENSSSWLTIGPLKKFNEYIHTRHIKLNDGVNFTGEYEVTGVVPDGVVDGVAIGMIGMDFDGNLNILKSEGEIQNETPNFVCSWPLGLYDDELVPSLPQLSSDNPDSVRRLLCGSQLVGNGSHLLN
ncbi:MAG TPA: M56 family metallopeptidase [Gammaproteobacteria bacterium]|nr:M56 family metallopeptidase [Xanthomonadales bacterium]HOP21603.1 M56 family metallopeptidase [Gammaproteobacteria bacterium]HPQ87304.1 M56 family metallopeptidase [Gammaproteobacteria bacterium]